MTKEEKRLFKLNQELLILAEEKQGRYNKSYIAMEESIGLLEDVEDLKQQIKQLKGIIESCPNCLKKLNKE